MHTGLWKMGSGLAAARRPEMTGLGALSDLYHYLSSQASSSRQLLMMLLTIIVQSLTRGCQQ